MARTIALFAGENQYTYSAKLSFIVVGNIINALNNFVNSTGMK